MTEPRPAVIVITPAVTVAYVVRGRLETGGFDCLHCRDAMEAGQQMSWLQSIGQPIAGIIAVDPDPDEAVLTQLRAAAPEARLVVLLNDGVMQTVWHCLRSPVDLVALEPVTANELQTAVRTGSFDTLSS